MSAQLQLGRAPRVRSFLEVLPGIFETELEEARRVTRVIGDSGGGASTPFLGLFKKRKAELLGGRTPAPPSQDPQIGK